VLDLIKNCKHGKSSMSQTFLYALWGVEHTIFEWAGSILNQHGFFFTTDKKQAHIIVAKFLPTRNIYRGVRFRLSFGTKTPILIWSDEPRDFPATTSKIKQNLFYPEIHVMNMYTGGVYRAPGSIYGYNADQPLTYMISKEYQDKKLNAVAVLTYNPNLNQRRLVMNGVNIDLFARRQNMVIHGAQIGCVDIFGAGWPEGVSKGSSGHRAGWIENKIEILRPYRFNICLENTSYPLYITEKIWHAVKGRCLPIYSSFNSSIYEIFSQESFVDIVQFENDQELFKFLQNMSASEYLERYNRCVDSFNQFHHTYNHKLEYKWMVEQLIGRLKGIRDTLGQTQFT
jgi:alpha(1,3/1,4) fucosyltransferase